MSTEEKYLYSFLDNNTAFEVDILAAKEQHGQILAQLQKLDPNVADDEFKPAVNRLKARMIQHAVLEEKRLVPAALQLISATDQQAISDKFMNMYR